MNQPLAQGRHSSQQDERETNLVQMNVKPCYCSSWLMQFGHSRASAFSLPSRSYFVHALAQMVRIEMLQWVANKKTNHLWLWKMESLDVVHLEPFAGHSLPLRGIFVFEVDEWRNFQ